MVEGNIDGSGEKMQQLREAGNRRSVPTVRRSQLPKWAKEVSGKKWGKQKLGENGDQFFRKKLEQFRQQRGGNRQSVAPLGGRCC